MRIMRSSSIQHTNTNHNTDGSEEEDGSYSMYDSTHMRSPIKKSYRIIRKKGDTGKTYQDNAMWIIKWWFSQHPYMDQVTAVIHGTWHTTSHYLPVKFYSDGQSHGIHHFYIKNNTSKKKQNSSRASRRIRSSMSNTSRARKSSKSSARKSSRSSASKSSRSSASKSSSRRASKSSSRRASKSRSSSKTKNKPRKVNFKRTNITKTHTTRAATKKKKRSHKKETKLYL